MLSFLRGEETRELDLAVFVEVPVFINVRSANRLNPLGVGRADHILGRRVSEPSMFQVLKQRSVRAGGETVGQGAVLGIEPRAFPLIFRSSPYPRRFSACTS